MPWHLLHDTTPRPGWSNMARDAALLDLAGRGDAFLRLYTWQPGCLSFGRHEPALRRYDRAAIAAQGLDTVRRPTGGRAVWHEAELTYAVAAPIAALGALREAYASIHQMLADALASFGLGATLAEDRRAAAGLDAGACFAAPVGGEVLLDGAKAVGSAQVRQGTALLQHGSILLGGSQEVVERVTRGAAPPVTARSVGAALGRPVPAAEVADAVAAAARRWQPAWHELRGQDPLAGASRVHEDRFRSADWTWRR